MLRSVYHTTRSRLTPLARPGASPVSAHRAKMASQDCPDQSPPSRGVFETARPGYVVACFTCLGGSRSLQKNTMPDGDAADCCDAGAFQSQEFPA